MKYQLTANGIGFMAPSIDQVKKIEFFRLYVSDYDKEN